MNYFTDIDYRVKKSAIEGVVADSLFNAVIEISNGDNVKYEVHPSGRYLTAVRTLNPIFRYPFSYGFIPQTLEEDGDDLDVIVVTPEPLAHLSVIEVRVLGFIPTVDGGVSDVKIVAVPAYSSLRKVSTDKIMAFLREYKYPNNKESVGEFNSDIAKTVEIIEAAHKRAKVALDVPTVKPVVKAEEKKTECVKDSVALTVTEAVVAQKEDVKLKPVTESVKEEPVLKEIMENKEEVPIESKEEVKADEPAPFFGEEKPLESVQEPIQKEAAVIDTEWLS